MRRRGVLALGMLVVAGAVGLGALLAHLPSVMALLPDPCPIELYKGWAAPGVHAIGMASHDAGWVVGESGLVFHDHGGTWKHECSPTSRFLSAVAAVSPDDAWAVGAQHPTQPKSAEPGRSVILHYRAGAWTRVASASCPSLSAVAMASPADGWALGRDENSQFCLLHYTAGGGCERRWATCRTRSRQASAAWR
jgi:hypothetical protein